MSIENENIRNETYLGGTPSKWRDIKDIKLLVVHHSAREYKIGENYKSVIISHAYSHKNKTWGYYSNGTAIKGNGLQYHYVIAPDGMIYKTRNWSEVTWHANNANSLGLGIMVMGNFQIQNPTQEQLFALEKLLKYLVESKDLNLKKSDVFAHGELTQYGNSTACCGYNLKDDVKRFREQGYIIEGKYEPQPDFKESFQHWLDEGVFSDKTDPNRQPTWQEIGEILYRYDNSKSS